MPDPCSPFLFIMVSEEDDGFFLIIHKVETQKLGEGWEKKVLTMIADYTFPQHSEATNLGGSECPEVS
jgi:hypothetical protein